MYFLCQRHTNWNSLSNLRAISQNSTAIVFSFDILDLESWWEGKTKLISLFSIIYNQRVKVLWASHLKIINWISYCQRKYINLEFGVLLVFLNFDRGGILTASDKKEFLDLVDLSWHFYIRFLNWVNIKNLKRLWKYCGGR